jgi:crotonobetainyl-CoA:carnitine CoA-transferase CaiB-like acyl-CoA transferase
VAGALEGIVVADLSDGMAGSYCTKLLAGLGAEVIKIEPPGRGDSVRSMPPFKDDVPNLETSVVHLHLSMGKKSISLNPSTATGKDLLRRLLEVSDVFVHSCLPPRLAELGIAEAELTEAMPRLVITAVTDFGQEGPYSGFKGGELVDYSLGGYAFLTGLPGREPIKAGGSQAMYQGGLHAALGTMAALFMREATGAGDHIDVSVTEAICYTHAAMSPYLNNGHIYRRVGARLLSELPQAPYPSTILPCRDGFMHVHWAPADPALLGVLTENPRLGEAEVWETPRGHADEIDRLLSDWLAEYDKKDAVRRAQELRHPFTEVMTPADLIEDPQFDARGFFREIEHPEAGRFKHVGAPFTMSETPFEVARAPLLGEHNREVYCRRLGLGQEELSALRDREVI